VSSRRWFGLASASVLVVLGLLAMLWAAQAYADETPPELMPFRAFLPLTLTSPSLVQEEPLDLVSFTYRLQADDDLAMLALRWGIDSEAIACVTRSGQEPLSGLRPGMLLMIPNARYRCHTVQPDETLDEIADGYGVTVGVLLDEPWNAIEAADEALDAGRRLLILDGFRPDLNSLRNSREMMVTAALQESTAAPAPAQTAGERPAVWPYGDGTFIWPVRGGVISQGFRPGHRAIDIAAPIGAPVYAADNGIVISSGYSRDGYGGRVIIDHQIDYVTLYAHLSQALVQEGDVVQKGQIIGYVGSTGNSTGPHIHFEIRDFGFLVDPRSLLTGER
jgi:murein DD-endopeptidase MepM/ murein hydrolase activator NlpD